MTLAGLNNLSNHKNMSEISDTSLWLNFFIDAGIPPGDATGYAITFSDNRIKQAMLSDLNKEYLRDMGITVMGDIIAILKHAKTVSNQICRQKVFPVGSASSSSNAAKSQNTNSQIAVQDGTATNPVRKTSAAARILEHYVRKEPPLPLPQIPSSSSSNLSAGLTARLGGTKRSIEDDDIVKSSKRSSVFKRLGDNVVSSTTSDAPKITVTMLGKDKMRSATEGSLKNLSRLRLDGKEQHTSPEPKIYAKASLKNLSRSRNDGKEQRTSPEPKIYGNPLPYAGVLKYSANDTLYKKISSMDSPPKSCYALSYSSALAETSGIRSRLGTTTKSLSQSEGIFAREMDDLRRSKSVKKEHIPKVKEKYLSVSSEISNPLHGKKIIKKIVKINKKTGQIVSEERIEKRFDLFSCLRE